MAGLEISRRNLMAVSVAAPMGLGAGPAGQPAPSAWAATLDVYRNARMRHEAFMSGVLDPALANARLRGEGLTTQICRLEDRGNDLLAARLEALDQLVAVPADGLAALRIKLRFVYEEVFQHEDHEGMLGVILEELERIALVA